jgi:hypothetical protein
MLRFFAVLLIGVMMLSGAEALAASNSSDLIKQGLLGAGAGAVGGAASGAKGKDVWKGALAGAGVNIIGGALLDSISGEKVNDVNNVKQMPPQDAYSEGYQDGFNNGYKQGYTEGYKEGLKENMTSSQ